MLEDLSMDGASIGGINNLQLGTTGSNFSSVGGSSPAPKKLKQWKKQAHDCGKCLVLGENNPKIEGQRKRKAGLNFSDNGLSGINPMEEDVVDKGTKQMIKEIRVEGIKPMSSGVAAASVQPRYSL